MSVINVLGNQQQTLQKPKDRTRPLRAIYTHSTIQGFQQTASEEVPSW